MGLNIVFHPSREVIPMKLASLLFQFCGCSQGNPRRGCCAGALRAIVFIVLIVSFPASLLHARTKKGGTTTTPALTSPAPGSVLPGSSVTFSWTADSAVTQYQLWVGSTAGTDNLGLCVGVASSCQLAGLPANGSKIYVTLEWEIGGIWTQASYTYSSASLSPALTGLGCTSGSMTGAGTDNCTVTLNAAAAAGGFPVSVASNNSAVAVPATVTVAVGATTASFSTAVSSVSTGVAVSLTACAGGVTKTFTLQLGAMTPTLGLSTSSLSFGNDAVNTATSQSITLSSTGTASVTVNADAISGAGFTVSGAAFPLTLSPNQTATLTVQFDPMVAGAASGSLTLTSNSSTASSTTVPLSGFGVAVSALACSKGSVTGAGTDACTVTLNAAAPSGGVITNLSSSSAAVTLPATVTVSAGSTSAGFTATYISVASTQSATLKATSATVSQSFLLQLNAAPPGITRNAHGLIDIGANTVSSPLSVALSGVAAGDLIVCEVSLESVATLVSVSDSMNGNYLPAIAMHTNSAITQQMGVYYFPNAAPGSYSVSVAWNGGPRMYQAMACQSWTGAATSSPLDPSMMQQKDNSSSSNATSGSTLTPAAAGELIIGSLSTLAQTPAAGTNYTLTDSAPNTRFWPEFWIQNGATATDSPYVNSPDTWTDQMIAFKTAISTPSAPPAAPAITGSASASGAVGTAFSYQIVATNTPTGYAASGLPAGLSVNSATGLISGTPTVAGTSAVALSATNSVGTGNANLSISIAASQALLSVNASTIAFGDVSLNSPATQVVTLSSTGTAAVTVSSAVALGSGFTVSGASFPLTLSPKQTASLSVQFDPTAAGAVTGTLTIGSTSLTNPIDVVSLSGTGGSASNGVSLTWAAPSNSIDPVAGYNIYRASSGSASYQQVNSSAIVGTAYTDTSAQAGQTYDYMVESVDASGVASVPSNMAGITMP